MDYKALNARLVAFALGAIVALGLALLAGNMFTALEPVGVAATGMAPAISAANS